MQKIALLIGVSDYRAGLPPLRSPLKDIESMQYVLQHPEMGGFTQVKTLSNPSVVTMQQEIEATFADLTKNDLVLLFFSGHGLTDTAGRFYFTTSETLKTPRNEISLATTVPASFVHDVMTNSDCKQQVTILDCCFSGAFTRGMTVKSPGNINLEPQLGGEGRAILTSSTAVQTSLEQQNSDISVYTRFIVEGIETGAADEDEDGKISVEELHHYAKQKVYDLTPSMKPEIYPFKEGNQIILANAPVRDAKLIYRRHVEGLIRQGEISKTGKVSYSGQVVSCALGKKLNLSPKETAAIAAEVLQPYREYLKRLRQFEKLLKSLPQKDNLADEQTRATVARLQEVWDLRTEDVEQVMANLAKPRACLNPLLLGMAGVGMAISIGTVSGISWKLYEQVPALQMVYPVLNQVHDRLDAGIHGLSLQLAHVLAGSEPDRWQELLPHIVAAQAARQHAIGATTTKHWDAAVTQWAKAMAQWQIAIDFIEQLPPDTRNYQEITRYLDDLKTEKLNAESEAKFAQATSAAAEAAKLVQKAHSKCNWVEVAEHWQKAIALMQAIPATSTKYKLARQKGKQECLKNYNYALHRSTLARQAFREAASCVTKSNSQK